jgi:adenosine deaminase
VIEAARDAGVHLVHHAGEFGGPASIREVVTDGYAERIGHGIRIIEDEALVAEVCERGIALEVCPTSNVLLGLMPSFGDHPLPQLTAAGLMVTLNSDGETELAAEYERARDVFGYSDAELAAFAMASIDASFAPEELKARLRVEVEDWLDSPGGR